MHLQTAQTETAQTENIIQITQFKQLKKTAQKEVEFYQNGNEAINSFKLPLDIKPCIASILKANIEEGNGFFRRSEYGLMIATELRDKGLEGAQIQSKLEAWNYNNIIPPMASSDIRGIIKQCYKTKDSGKYYYNYICSGKHNEGLQIAGHCIGMDTCYYFLTHKNKGQKGLKYDLYLDIGFQYILTQIAQNMLQAIIRLEQKRQTVPGYTLITTYRELHYQTGYSKGHIREILEALEAYGLIELKVGAPYLWRHTGTKITRLSLQNISKETLELIQKAKDKLLKGEFPPGNS